MRLGTGRMSASGSLFFWVTCAGSVLLVVAVFVGLFSLHSWSDQHEAQSRSLATLRTDVALEQEGIRDPTASVATDRFQDEAERALSLIMASPTQLADRSTIVEMIGAYQAAASAQVAALGRGDLQAANRIYASEEDPAFTRLDAKLSTVVSTEAASAAVGVALAFWISMGIFAAAGIGILVLVLFARRRHARIVAVEAAQRVVAAREETFRSLFDESPQPMLVTMLPTASTEGDRLQILSANQAAVTAYGYSHDEFLAMTLADIRPDEDLDLLVTNLQALQSGRMHFDDVRHETKSGEIREVEIDARQTVFNGHSALIICPSDVTDRVKLQRELEHQAFHDALTGLPNRSLFNDRLKHVHERMQRSPGYYAVLMVDLDNFKTVNDSLGHAAGDALLVEVSQRLTTGIRPGDTAARLGGDEFAILLEDLDNPAAASVAAERLHEVLRVPLPVAGRDLTITATVGVASSSGGGASTDAVRNADVALYVAKADGKDRHTIYSDHMHDTAMERLTLEQDLRVGIGRNELMLMYQPKVDAQTGTMVGVEALVRWNHPQRGLLSPDTFIPIAEQSGLINELDTWVLTAACWQAQQWATSNVGPVPVAVNVSGRSLVSCKLLERVVDALRTTCLDPRLLELEITESAAIPQNSEAMALLQSVRDLGVRIAIDDFGTGYSVLSRLEGFPVDTLKIDLSFIRSIVSEGDEAPIVDAMIAMGLSLGLKVVAEGVETDVQRAYLASRNCPELQGYLISRPIAPEMVATFLLPTRTNTTTTEPRLPTRPNVKTAA